MQSTSVLSFNLLHPTHEYTCQIMKERNTINISTNTSIMDWYTLYNANANIRIIIGIISINEWFSKIQK